MNRQNNQVIANKWVSAITSKDCSVFESLLADNFTFYGAHLEYAISDAESVMALYVKMQAIANHYVYGAIFPSQNSVAIDLVLSINGKSLHIIELLKLDSSGNVFECHAMARTPKAIQSLIESLRTDKTL